MSIRPETTNEEGSLRPLRGQRRGQFLILIHLGCGAQVKGLRLGAVGPVYLVAPSRRPGLLRVDRLLSEYGIPKHSPSGAARVGTGVGGAAQGSGGEGGGGDGADREVDN